MLGNLLVPPPYPHMPPPKTHWDYETRPIMDI